MNDPLLPADLRSRRLVRLRRAAIWALAVLALVGLLGFGVVPPLLKGALVKQLSSELHREVLLNDVAINPFALSLTLRTLVVKSLDGKGETLAFDELYANLEVISLFRGGLVVSQLSLVKPRLKLVRLDKERFDVSDIVDALLARPAGEPSRFSVANIQIIDGAIDVDDRVLGQTHSLSDIRVGVPVVSNLPVDVETYVEPAFEARLDGAVLAIDAKARPFRELPDASIEFSFKGLNLATWLAYAPRALPVSVLAAKADGRLTLGFRQEAGKPPGLTLGGTLSVTEAELRDSRNAALAKWSRLSVVAKPSRLLERELLLASVVLEGAEVNISRDAQGEINLLRLLPAAHSEAKGKAPPFHYEVDEARADGAALLWSDARVLPAFSTRIELKEARLRNFASDPAQPAQFELAVAGGNGETAKLAATGRVAPLALAGHIEFAGVTPQPYRAYYAELLRFDIAQATLAAASDFTLSQGDTGPRLALSGLAAELGELKLRHAGSQSEFFSIASLSLKGGELDLAARTLSLGSVSSRDGRLAVVRQSEGGFDLLKLLPAPAAALPAPDAAASAAWQFGLGKLALDAWALRVEDRSSARPVVLVAEKIQLGLEHLSTAAGSQAAYRLTAALGSTGKLAADGSLRLTPLTATARIEATHIDMLPLQPYFTEQLDVALSRAWLSAKGDVELAANSGGNTRLRYKGDVFLEDFRSVDKANDSELLSWKSLHLAAIDAAAAPLTLDIGQISLSEFYSRLIIDADGGLNLRKIVRGAKPSATQDTGAARAVASTAEPGARQATAGETPQVRIGRISLKGGKVDFSDHFVKPNYSADMAGIAGTVGEFSTKAGSAADVAISGHLDGGAPLSISGRINPLAQDLLLDITAKVRDIELAPLTPYSAKYAGYAIDKGKLSMDVAYKIENRKLEAKNELFLDQLTFGEPTDSPDATKLPVLLAVALLKNSKGEININLPISGSLDDPEFSFGAIVGKVIVNLVVKAVTAPFALLGAIFGGGEELAYLEYAPGRADIDEPGRSKLASLAKALNDRPGLRLEIAGRIDPASDRDAYKRVLLDRQLKQLKLADGAKQGAEAANIDALTLSAAEYAHYLEIAYKAAKFKKARNLIGLTKSLPVAEMEQLMLANAELDEADLRELASDRAQNAKAWLVTEGKVPAERVFIVAPRLGAEDSNTGARASRADFSLK